MRKYIQTLGVFVIGFIIGLIFYGFLSVKASKMYLEIIRINYIIDQESSAKRAFKNKRLEEAVCNYLNVLDVLNKKTFSKKEIWSIDFPLSAIVLENIQNKISEKEKAIKIEKGIIHAKLGFIYQKMGLTEKSKEEYIKASQLMKITDFKKIQKFAEKLLIGENAL